MILLLPAREKCDCTTGHTKVTKQNRGGREREIENGCGGEAGGVGKRVGERP